jgi:anaerobic ribonucleoside-triphosphate reductase activating protein
LCLTELGKARLKAFDRPLTAEEKTLDIMFDDEAGSVFIAGIPRRGDITKLAGHLTAMGHLAVTSEDKRQTP